MPQLPEKIKLIIETNEGYHLDRIPDEVELAEKLNEIIDYLGELEGGEDGGN
jgi:hypothetical protein